MEATGGEKDAGEEARAKVLECVVCLNVTAPPWQTCMNGHLICVACEKDLRAKAAQRAPSPPSPALSQMHPGQVIGPTVVTLQQQRRLVENSLRASPVSNPRGVVNAVAQPVPHAVCPACKVVLGIQLPRALGLEQFVAASSNAALTCDCPNAGCSVRVPLVGTNTHSTQCLYRPIACSSTGCTWNGPIIQWNTHITEAHRAVVIELQQDSPLVDLRPAQYILACGAYRFILGCTGGRPVPTHFYVHAVGPTAVVLQLHCCIDKGAHSQWHCRIEPEYLGYRVEFNTISPWVTTNQSVTRARWFTARTTTGKRERDSDAPVDEPPSKTARLEDSSDMTTLRLSLSE
jgi:hypothetical protein